MDRLQMKTFCEFTFEAAHSVPPFSRLHGHTFVAKLTFGGAADPTFGWPVNLYDVENFIEELKGTDNDPGIDHANLDEIAEIGVASLENISAYLFDRVKDRFPNLEEVELRRGLTGTSEGCVCRSGRLRDEASAA
jgi:6-pyruvoyltetrahydropterin/6-carboxytetrahydropterin synthase